MKLPFFFRTPRVCFFSAFSAVVFLLVGAVAPGQSREVARLEGENPGGFDIVLIVPSEPHPEVIGIARQLETVTLTRGSLTLVETNELPAGENLAAFLNELANGPRPVDWVWVHRGPASAADKLPLLKMQSAGPGSLQATAEEAMGTEVVVEHISRERPQGIRRGILELEYPERTPLSRQNRYTRELSLALLRLSGMLEADAGFSWERLSQQAPTLVALYDAEGIGGNGPANLQQIAAEHIAGAGVYRVSGEDIREGALTPALGVIFPGGSGRGIGLGLQDQGREIVRDFVASGGGYLGVCAGAYFAASGLNDYLQAVELTHSQPWARGRSRLEIELTAAGREFFGSETTVLSTSYVNGPVFLPEDQANGGDPDFLSLAVFRTPSTDRNGVVREEMVGQTAIGSRLFGDGRILTISPHPEAHSEHHAFVARALAWTLSREAVGAGME